ncbi:ribosomal-processing cysteine protease Prp [Lachnobacterium bovis]|uniref:Ribosomal processing cysteine protease Prp n=1 Tax=Lachnobacterium bovis TaxID=140626 RepID=A0A1H9QQX2_9FIRM|nr:ribosomal-processing cysteine protease Prp [Lachnobacterium bovis]SER62848.1 hypothetical protein SAMN02910429_00653 [Lachnobacterium bovis]
MIEVVFYKNKRSRFTGFTVNGHAGYAEEGEDIVCAAVSALVYSTENALDKLTNARYSYGVDDGYFDLNVKGLRSRHDVQLLLKAFEISIIDINNKYGDKYLTISYEEV